jgi:hypothetical protein
MKKYVMPVTEIVTVEMPKLLGGTSGKTGNGARRIYVIDDENTTENNIFSETPDAEKTDWGN